VRVLDNKPLLSAKDLRLLLWASDYYHHPLDEVLSSAFPAGLRQGNSIVIQSEKRYALTDLGKVTPVDQLQRTPKQKSVLEKFQGNSSCLSESELTTWNDNWWPAVKQLIAKQLLQIDLSEARMNNPEASSSIAEIERHSITLTPAPSTQLRAGISPGESDFNADLLPRPTIINP